MRVRILCLVVLGLLIVAPVSSWAICSEIDPDGVCLNQTDFSFGAEPGPVIDSTTSSSRSGQARQAPTDITEEHSGNAISKSLVASFLHWLADLMPSV